MRVFRVRYQKRGGHIHTRVFSAVSEDATFAKLGELTFDETDWRDFIESAGSGWQFVNEDDPVRIMIKVGGGVLVNGIAADNQKS